MARTRVGAETKRPADLSTAQMREGLRKLGARLEDLKFNFTDWGPELQDRIDRSLEKVDLAMIDVFGQGTVEYDRFAPARPSYSLVMGQPTPDHEFRDGYLEAVRKSAGRIEDAIERLEERLEDQGIDPTARVARSFEGMDLHPQIAAAVGERFKNRHYVDAVSRACLALKSLVQIKSGLEDKDGADLMRQAFSPNKPFIRFVPDPSADETARSEQEGMMHLYEGVMLAFRNPRAHQLREDDAEAAGEMIALINFLAMALDRAES